MKSLDLIQLNEVNFDLVNQYVSDNPSKFKNFKKIINSFDNKTTFSEKEYSLLEPWIQWYSAYTGLTAEEHKVFHLGDSKSKKFRTFFDDLNHSKIKMGLISPMNLNPEKRTLEYFVSDPWMNLESHGDIFINRISRAVSNLVNKNANGFELNSFLSYFWLLFGIMRYAQIKNYLLYFQLVINSRRKSWCKPLLLDLFLSDMHISMKKKKKVSFSSLFLNAGAHIQHHYLSNSSYLNDAQENPSWYVEKKHDPFKDMLTVYDVILKNILENSRNLIIATGLTQKTFERPVFYYRLKNHEAFLKKMDIKFSLVEPRMSRDFLISFECESDLNKAIEKLSMLKSKKYDIKLFEVLDKLSNKELFVSLTYPNEIRKECLFNADFLNKPLKIYSDVSFVAIKNADHHEKGFFFSNSETTSMKEFHIKNLNKIIKNYYEAN